MTAPTHELVIDNFAGGGGASTGIEAAIGRPIDYAINHDPEALAMHLANHPHTQHLCESIFSIHPRDIVHDRPVALTWLSPDCAHFSRAKGATPLKKEIRALAWIALRWAARARPRILMLENVVEFKDWGPLTRKRGRPKHPRPDPRGKSETFEKWKSQIEGLGYVVKDKVIKACDHGAPTIRKRLFIIARRDGQPIVWPEATHGPGRPLPYRTAAECIDWSIPCPSIFERKRPLAEKTLQRIARGIVRFVIEAKEPFILTTSHTGTTGRSQHINSIREPLRTLCGSNDKAIVAASLIQNNTNNAPQDVDAPLGTVTTGNRHFLECAHLVKHYGGMTGVGVDTPLPTTTTRGTQNQVVVSNLVHMRNNCDARDMREPLPTLTAGGGHVAEVRAFLMKYYSAGGKNNQGQRCDDPMHTLTQRARLGLVTVHGIDYQIADIGMRMLTPRELFNAQGFPPDYIIDPDYDTGPEPDFFGQGDAIPRLRKPLTKTAQIKMCGNSVCPPVAEALVRANYPEATRQEAIA